MREKSFAVLTRLLASRRRGFLFEDALLGLYAETLEDSIFITDQTKPPDCLTCGACCAYFHQILISTEDSTPRALAWEVADADGQVTHWLKREAGEARCVALSGTIGGQVDCLIYELRPTACRAFEAGSDRCHALRSMYGLEPRLSANESDHHFQLLKENHCEDTFDLAIPDNFDGEQAQIKFLRELIVYNLDKLEAVVGELKRLKDLFNASGAIQAEQHCQQVLKITNHEMASLTKDFEELKIAKPNESMNQFLAIGNASQEMLEDATKRLAEMGELAFAVLGMQAKFSECIEP
jgi:Fe-S-cluster containining protein